MLIKLKVHPGSRREELLRKTADSFEVWVKAPAERGQANAACLRLLAAALSAAEKRLRIIKGSTSTSKIVKLWD